MKTVSKTQINNSGGTRMSSWGKMVRNDFRVNKALYLMVVPIMLFYIAFHYAPMYGITMAFQDFRPAKGFLGSEWVGLEHFKTLFSLPSFKTLIANTFRISFKSIVFGFPAPIILALLINELRNARFAKFVQNLTYMPHFISMVVMCSLIRNFTLDTGIINYIMSFFGHDPVTLLNDPKYFDIIYVASDIWQGVGWGSIIYLAALTGIDPTLYEAAEVDGANKWRQVIHITLPGILPTITIMLVLRLGGVLNVGYEKLILLYNDLTMPRADVISTYVYRKGLIDLSWSFSAAVGIFNSVVNFVFVMTSNYISRKVNGIGLW